MFVAKDFAWRRADMREFRRAPTFLPDEAFPNKIFWYEHWNYPNEHVYQFWD